MAPWLIDCKEYSRLSSKGMDQPLILKERIKVLLHELFCPPCGCVKSQWKGIRKACRQKPDNISVDPVSLPEDACKAIKSALRRCQPRQ